MWPILERDRQDRDMRKREREREREGEREKETDRGREREREMRGNSISSMMQIHFVSCALPLIHHSENGDNHNNHFFQPRYLAGERGGSNLITGICIG